ncbi:MAG: hypothetical protein CM15mP55_0910 [Hyphomicrobiales bacterium]|nr:MAG: hypothetical protein CM15mP55_0910 [Hyphomicrobiales bacterium]
MRLNGFAGLPTFNHATAQKQYLVVNGRPVRDKLLNGAVRGAYQIFWPVIAIRRWPCSLTLIRPSLTSMCIRQNRSPLPRQRAGARHDCRGVARGAGRGRTPRRNHRGRPDIVVFPAGRIMGQRLNMGAGRRRRIGRLCRCTGRLWQSCRRRRNWLSTAGTAWEEQAPTPEPICHWVCTRAIARNIHIGADP